MHRVDAGDETLTGAQVFKKKIIHFVHDILSRKRERNDTFTDQMSAPLPVLFTVLSRRCASQSSPLQNEKLRTSVFSSSSTKAAVEGNGGGT